MTGDELEVEAQLSGILDRLGLEMQQAAMRLRFAPYAAVEKFIEDARQTLQQVALAGDMTRKGQLATAIALCSFITVPEIQFEEGGNCEPQF
jgi:hypothetical protein